MKLTATAQPSRGEARDPQGCHTSDMDVVQMYETTVGDRDGDPAYTFLSIPSRALPDREDLGTSKVSDVARALRIEEGPSFLGQGGVFIEQSVVNAVSFTLNAPNLREAGSRYEGWAEDALNNTDWARYLATEPLVPFESSPLSGQSVAQVAGASAGAVGASVGALVTGDPILLVTVPAGIIICGAAAGIADGLRVGTRYWILKLMGVPDADHVEPPPEHGEP